MQPQSQPRGWKIGRLALATVLLGSVIVNIVLFAMYVSRPRHDAAASDQPVPPLIEAGASTAPSVAPAVADQARADRRSPPDTTPSAGAAERDARLSDRGTGRRTDPSSLSVDGSIGADSHPGSTNTTASTSPAGAVLRSGGESGTATPATKAAGSAHNNPAVVTAGIAGAVDSVATNPAAGSSAEKPAPSDTAVQPDDAHSDRRPPVIQGLRFDPPEIPDGSASTFFVTATDDLSGVQRITGTLRSPSGVASIIFEAVDDGSGTQFAAKIAIPAKAETGNWWIGNLYLLDKAQNPLAATFTAASAPAGGLLRVVSAQSDSTPPDVRRVWVDTLSANAGDKNRVNVEVEDLDSGVESVSGAFQSPARTAILEFLCRAGADPGVWTGDVVIPKDADCGEWTLLRLRVRDKAGNTANLGNTSPQLSRVAFGVSGDACDSTPPTLDSLSLSTAFVTNDAPSEIVVSAVVHDVGSGVASMVGVVSGPAGANQQVPTILFTCAQVPNDTSGLWTGKIKVPQFAAQGPWRVTLVRLWDRAQNRREYNSTDPALRQGTFEVR